MTLSLLFPMMDDDIDSWIGVVKPRCQLFCAIDRSVLATCASKIDTQVGETTFEVFVDTLCHNGFAVLKKL